MGHLAYEYPRRQQVFFLPHGNLAEAEYALDSCLWGQFVLRCKVCAAAYKLQIASQLARQRERTTGQVPGQGAKATSPGVCGVALCSGSAARPPGFELQLCYSPVCVALDPSLNSSVSRALISKMGIIIATAFWNAGTFN